MARDFGGIFEYFLKYVNLVVANPIEFCANHKIRNAAEIKGIRIRKLVSKLTDKSDIEIKGNMVLIKRGGCSFMEKSFVAQEQGAIGAIIYNNDANDIDSNIDMVDDESGREIDIPVMWLVGRNGHMMVESMLDVRNISPGHLY